MLMSGGALTPHPALLLAQRVTSVHSQQELVHSPVLVPLKEKDLAVGPGEGRIRGGGHSGEEHVERFGVERQTVVAQLIKLPVLRSLHTGRKEEVGQNQ